MEDTPDRSPPQRSTSEPLPSPRQGQFLTSGAFPSAPGHAVGSHTSVLSEDRTQHSTHLTSPATSPMIPSKNHYCLGCTKFHLLLFNSPRKQSVCPPFLTLGQRAFNPSATITQAWAKRYLPSTWQTRALEQRAFPSTLCSFRFHGYEKMPSSPRSFHFSPFPHAFRKTLKSPGGFLQQNSCLCKTSLTNGTATAAFLLLSVITK